jgi:small subunit ribosomal protein S19
MSRSIWKGFYVNNNIIQLAKKRKKFSKKDKEKIIKITSRNSTIIDSLVGQKIQIYNGKQFFRKTIRKEMVGHKFGEFAYTRQKYEYKKNKKNTKKK